MSSLPPLCEKCGSYANKLAQDAEGYVEFFCHQHAPKESIWMEQQRFAAKYAEFSHRHQTRDGGGSYFKGHLEVVANILKQLKAPDHVICAAYLHDILEDTDITYHQLKDLFGPLVAELVAEVTHEGQKDKYGYYFPRLKSKEAIMIKFADRLANISDMDSWDEDRQKHYLKRSKFWKDGSDR